MKDLPSYYLQQMSSLLRANSCEQLRQSQQLVIFGAGRSGIAAANLAAAKNVSHIALIDESNSVRPKTLNTAVDFISSWKAETPLDFTPDLAILSPGIPLSSPVYEFCRLHKIPLCGELDYAAAWLPATTELFGITGTNGKTTSTELLTHCLQQQGLPVIAAGNIGLPLAEVALMAEVPQYVALEISSFQLDLAATLRLETAVIINLCEDHGDRYPAFSDYLASKARIACLTDKLFLSDEAAYLLPNLSATIFSTKNAHAALSIKENSFFIKERGLSLALPAASSDLQGEHNLQNCLAVLCLISASEIDLSAAALAFNTFTSGNHRQQLLPCKDGIHFVNDSKATNPHALLQALKRFGDVRHKSLILIAGGSDKKSDFSIVHKALSDYVRAVYVYGECSRQLQQLWKPFVEVHICEQFDEAVQSALAVTQAGETLLLSPGCASFDQFSSYAQRGLRFTQLISKDLSL